MIGTGGRSADERLVEIPAGSAVLEGNLGVPFGTRRLVVFAHGSGSNRYAPRNRYVARALREQGVGTLLLDLMTPTEEVIDMASGELRYDQELLADRLVHVKAYLRRSGVADEVAFFGDGSGAGVALLAAARCPQLAAVICRGGRIELSAEMLGQVRARTLLLVGGQDQGVLQLNQAARTHLRCESALEVIPGATHLFEEAGALRAVALRTGSWVQQAAAEAPVPRIPAAHDKAPSSTSVRDCAAA